MFWTAQDRYGVKRLSFEENVTNIPVP